MRLKMVMDSLCIRKRRLACYFWFVLLFGVGGLVLLMHQQDLSDLVQQQSPGMKPKSTLQQPRESIQAADNTQSSPILPMQIPDYEKSQHEATSMPLERDISSVQVTKSDFVSASQENWRKLSEILEARRMLMKTVCAKYKSKISKTITRNHVKFLYVEEKYKLLYCQVPKAGCSNWKRVLMVLGGQASNAQTIEHEAVHFGGFIKTLDRFNQSQIKHRLQTYKKVLFVREPFERVVSAYRDKFENPEKYYHSVFGRAIISKYRMNSSAQAQKTGDGVSFKEFIQYLLDVHRPRGMDIHWERVSRLCHPCLIDYDLIGKFENMEEESNFLLRLIGAPPSLTLPSFKDRNPRDVRTSMEMAEKYFSQVNMTERQRVYDFYHMDYIMFNYSKPFKELYR